MDLKIFRSAWALLFPLFVVVSSCSDRVPPAIEPDPEMEQKIEAILRDMTLEEKVGQMAW